jgi:hypothetical protein
MIWIAIVGIIDAKEYCMHSICDRLLVRKSMHPPFVSNRPYAKLDYSHNEQPAFLYFTVADRVDKWFNDNEIQYELKWYSLKPNRELKIGMNSESATLFLLTWSGSDSE